MHHYVNDVLLFSGLLITNPNVELQSRILKYVEISHARVFGVVNCQNHGIEGGVFNMNISIFRILNSTFNRWDLSLN